MLTDPLFRLSITFALIAGTAAALLALLTWEVFRQSAFGKAIFFLTFFMSVFILYHTVLITIAAESILVEVIESIVYTGFAIVVWSIAWTHPSGGRTDDA